MTLTEYTFFNKIFHMIAILFKMEDATLEKKKEEKVTNTGNKKSSIYKIMEKLFPKKESRLHTSFLSLLGYARVCFHLQFRQTKGMARA